MNSLTFFGNTRLSTLYYERKLARAIFWSRTFEIVIGLGTAGTTGTGVAALTIWKENEGLGKWAWGVIAFLSTILAFLKPIFPPGSLIGTYSKQHQGWFEFYFVVKRLQLRIQGTGAFTDASRREFEDIYRRYAKLSQNDDKPIDSWLVRRLNKTVDREIPVEALAVPSLNLMECTRQGTSHESLFSVWIWLVIFDRLLGK